MKTSIVILVIIILGIGGWFFFQDKTKINENINTQQGTNIINNNQTNTMAKLTPSQTWTNWRTQMSQLETFDDAYKLQLEYSNSSTVTSLKEHEQEAYNQSEADKRITVETLNNKEPKINEITIVREKIEGTQATLELATKNPKFSTGEVTLLDEGGEWKIVREIFKFAE